MGLQRVAWCYPVRSSEHASKPLLMTSLLNISLVKRTCCSMFHCIGDHHNPRAGNPPQHSQPTRMFWKPLSIPVAGICLFRQNTISGFSRLQRSSAEMKWNDRLSKPIDQCLYIDDIIYPIPCYFISCISPLYRHCSYIYKLYMPIISILQYIFNISQILSHYASIYASIFTPHQNISPFDYFNPIKYGY